MNAITSKISRPLAAGVAVLVLAAAPGVAWAQTDDPTPDRSTDRVVDDRPLRDRDIDAVKQRIVAAIERRLDALERMSTVVAENEHISANHAAHLQNDYREAERILEDALAAVEDAETLAELREVVPQAFEETLVFALLRPKTSLVIGSHSMVAVGEHMAGFAEILQSIIDRLSERGLDMSEAQATLDAMTGHLADAEALAEPVAGNVVDLDQADWPDPAKAALEQGRTDLQGAREALRQARGEARDTILAIREALSS